jgi:hypothetical protein
MFPQKIESCFDYRRRDFDLINVRGGAGLFDGLGHGAR